MCLWIESDRLARRSLLGQDPQRSMVGRCVPSKTLDDPFLKCILGAIRPMHLEPVPMFVCVCQSLSVDFSFLVNFS